MTLIDYLLPIQAISLNTVDGGPFHHICLETINERREVGGQSSILHPILVWEVVPYNKLPKLPVLHPVVSRLTITSCVTIGHRRDESVNFPIMAQLAQLLVPKTSKIIKVVLAINTSNTDISTFFALVSKHVLSHCTCALLTSGHWLALRDHKITHSV